MNTQDVRIARQLKEAIANITPVLDFRVFGSRARGNSGDYSDLDIFLKIDDVTKETKEAIYHCAWKMSLQSGVFISVLIFTRFELEHTPLRSSDIVDNIMREGVLL